MPLEGYTKDADALSIAWKLEHDVSDVWLHLTSLRHLPEWLGRARSGGISSGDILVVDHGDGYLCTSVVEGIDDERSLSMSWEFPDEPLSHLSVIVEAVEEEDQQHCLLRLRHSGLKDLADSYLPGWITHLTYFEGSLQTTPLPQQAFWRLYETYYRLTAGT